MNGNCYWFAYILCGRFPELEIYYEPIVGHFVAGDGEKFYDWTGETKLAGPPIKLDRIKQDDKI